MRICLIAEPNSTHTEKWLIYTTSQGAEVHLLGWEEFRGPVLPGLHFHLLPASLCMPKWHVIAGALFRVGLGNVSFVPAFRRLLDEIQPDVVDILSVGPGYYEAALACRYPLVITPWGSDLLVMPQKYPPHQKILLRLALRKAALVLCNSRHLAQAAIRYGTRAEIIRYAGWPSVHLKDFAIRAKDSVLLNELNLRGKRILLSPRSLNPLYHIHTIIEAFPFVLEKIPDAALVLMAGQSVESAYFHQLKEQVERLGVADSVRWIGLIAQAEMPRYYSLADVCLSVPASDSRPATIFEAMASGVPLIVSNVPSVMEVVEHGKNGLVVPIGDSLALAQAIIELLGNDDLYQRCRQNGLATATPEACDYASVMGSIFNNYLELTGRKVPTD